MICLTFLLLTANQDEISLTKTELVVFRGICRGGGDVQFGWERPELGAGESPREVVAVQLGPHTTTDRTLTSIGVFKELRELDLRYCYRISDAGVKELSRLENLEVLYMMWNSTEYQNPQKHLPTVKKKISANLTDNILTSLSRCKSLKKLYIAGNSRIRIQDGILPPALERLVVSEGQVSDSVLARWKKTNPACSIQVLHRSSLKK